MSKKVAIQTLGCRANQSDGESLETELRRAGFEMVPFEERADCYIINSCTVTAEADKEARRLIRKAFRQNENSLKIVTGCYVQVAPEELSNMKEIDYLVPNTEKNRIAEIIFTHFPPTDFGGLTPHPAEEKIRSRAYVKIQDGCNFRCSFCIIPFARGNSRSRTIPEIICEIQDLSRKGYHEVVLTGIHIGSYGWDQKPKQTFFDLMLALEMVKPIGRIRLSTLDPDEVSKEMIDLIAASDFFCPHLHIAIQSGEDEILERMRRRHKTTELLEITRYADSKIKNLGLGADVITGFPGESLKQHEATHDLLDALPLAYLHVFPYSERKGTPAVDYPNAVPLEERRGRAKELIDLGGKKKRLFWESQLGMARKVVLEEMGAGGYQKGTTDNFIPLWVPETKKSKGSLATVVLQRLERGRIWGQCL